MNSRESSTDNLHNQRRWIQAKNRELQSEEGTTPFHEGIQTSLGFHYNKAEHLIEAFQNKRKSYTYSRQSSPTIAALEKKINDFLGTKSTIVFSTGMAAISDTFFSLLKKGDHIVTSKFLFGNTLSFFKTLERMGFAVSYADVSSAAEVERSLQPSTKFFFTETVSNPLTIIPDFKNISALLKETKIISIIDNTLTPTSFHPKDWGFSLEMLSLSKYMAGHSHVLAGSISDTGCFVGKRDSHIQENYQKLDPDNCMALQIRKKGIRDQGATLSPFGGFLVAQGMDTLALRIAQHQKNVVQIAQFLSDHPKVKKVNFPTLSHHPQYERGKELFSSKSQEGNQLDNYGSVLSFELESSQRKDENGKAKLEKAVELLNHFKTILLSTHVGDLRTLALPVAPTIFNDLGVEGRKEIGIAENLIRLSVGIEDIHVLLEDLEQALGKI